ncbi:hypothetical protein ACFSHT_04280 [Paraburkholderia silviterrae]|uniref:Proteophosphoglycan ppg4 n=1 Tax=Paraburkholderia silviterrae TaxID=2528715 RepID=A0A4R5M324_9BURK|nr:hypothetical protein [Paraburkholderia silviterrae]TDG20021.1 hypothetical protein EYW47_28095 [Paraburkholderia silviterrae]
MHKAISTLIAAGAALALSGVAYAQNNTLATPTTKSPAAAAVPPSNATSGYGMPGATSSDSGMGAAAPNSGMQNGMSNSAAPGAAAYGTNNTLATPSTKSPGAGQ